ncbi:unnamed protein product [Ilex paraguariensis]|uniref:DNA-directed RNA polymerase III subunit RPC9 n=1 Tax=Ilex paraguariensis TaxID=185542 RepID=A0ABC8TPR2_9AQUA
MFCRLEADCGALTYFEVLDFLRSRGAGKDPTRVLASVAPSEFKVYDYLEKSVACNQTRESISDFLGKCKKYNLAKSEILNIINVRPSSVVEIDPIIDDCDTRMGDTVEELVEMVVQVLPPPTIQMESIEVIGQDKEENPEERQMDAS